MVKCLLIIPLIVGPLLTTFILSSLFLPDLPVDVVNSIGRPFQWAHQQAASVARNSLHREGLASGLAGLVHEELQSWRFRALIAPVAGLVETCCCEVELVEQVQPSFHSLLESLVSHSFFKYFLVNYQQVCPFWVEEHLCSAADASEESPCGICECPLEEVPALIKSKDDAHAVNRTLGAGFERFSDRAAAQWIEWDQTDQLAYVNLEFNPERYTGYKGNAAREIWKIIYEENCFVRPSDDNQCVEERVFYRIISGLHASTTIHFTAQHQRTGEGWLPNLDMFIWRLGLFPDRMKNVYFNYIFLLRAIGFLKPLVHDFSDPVVLPVFATGLESEDLATSSLLQQFFRHPIFDMGSCVTPLFDETTMFQSPDSQLIRDEFRTKFRNISRIMDCVACESCKLHAKLQVLGLGTALKILFQQAPTGDSSSLLSSLQRNEVMALFQTLFKFSESIHLFHQMQALEKSQLYFSLSVALSLSVAILVAFMLLLVRLFSPGKQPKLKNH